MKKKKLHKIIKKVKAGVLGDNALLLQLPGNTSQAEVEDITIYLHGLKLPNPIIVIPRESDFDEYDINDLRVLRCVIDRAVMDLEKRKKRKEVNKVR